MMATSEVIPGEQLSRVHVRVVGTLRHSDETLGIDAEFTRPGVVSMLEQLQEKVEVANILTTEEGMDSAQDLTFDFKVGL